MKLTKLILSISILLISTQILPAQKIWKKDWKALKAKEAFKVLNNSPWARNINNIEVSYSYTDINSSIFDRTARLGAAPPIIVRLYSSLKIRQTLLRLRQLQVNYDKLDKKKKSKFDKINENFLDCKNCKNYYVIILLQQVSKPGVKSLIGYKFKDLKLEDLKGKFYLTNDKKERRDLEQFIAPKTDIDPAILYFPIMDEEQKPLVTNESKKFTLKFNTNLIKGTSFLQDVDFNIPKMLVNGKLDF